VLLHDGIITQAQLYQALHLQRQTNRLLGTCLVSLGYVIPEVLLATQSRLMDLPAMPPGVLLELDEEAVKRVPRELCLQLRVVPYLWDGQVLGVAIADERVMEHLPRIAEAVGASVGACLALESDIDAALMQLFGRTHPEEPPRVIQGAPPRAPPPMQTFVPTILERTSFYDAIAHIYELPSIEAVGGCIGSALLNYFVRVLVYRREGQHVHLCSFAGAEWVQPTLSLAAIPHVLNTWENQRFVYGSTKGDPRGLEICTAAGIRPAPTALIAIPGEAKPPDLLVYADNGESMDLYEDTKDISLLLKESDTALSLLQQ
jgi:hypothetical protein